MQKTGQVRAFATFPSLVAARDWSRLRGVALPAPVDAVVIGGGPAGSAAGRLLASWGHSVVMLDQPAPRSRGLAESIPPSTRKLLAETGVLADVERADFFRSSGNTVWWASDQPRLEMFAAAPARPGYQVFRPDFDRVLTDSARAAGVDVRRPAQVRSVSFGEHARVAYEHQGRRATIACRFVLDCSGRVGIVGRRFRRLQPAHRTLALVGVWESRQWDLPDVTHTAVETCEDGWAWSVPVSATRRHVGVMVAQGENYHAAVAKTTHIRRTLEAATLEHDWACDASLYFAQRYAGPGFLLVGDAGSFIDPLSSFGVKKALASAWLAAIAAHTALVDPERETIAFDFFSNWERDVYASHLRRSREFARSAATAHPSAFWTARADTVIAAPDVADVAAGPPRFGARSDLHLELADDVCFEPRPVIRGREIVLEQAFAGGLRFVEHVDLVKLADMACSHRRVADLFDAYCRACPPVPLPNVVSGLSVLVARGILHDRS